MNNNNIATAIKSWPVTVTRKIASSNKTRSSAAIADRIAATTLRAGP